MKVRALHIIAAAGNYGKRNKQAGRRASPTTTFSGLDYMHPPVALRCIASKGQTSHKNAQSPNQITTTRNPTRLLCHPPNYEAREWLILVLAAPHSLLAFTSA